MRFGEVRDPLNDFHGKFGVIVDKETGEPFVYLKSTHMVHSLSRGMIVEFTDTSIDFIKEIVLDKDGSIHQDSPHYALEEFRYNQRRFEPLAYDGPGRENVETDWLKEFKLAKKEYSVL